MLAGRRLINLRVFSLKTREDKTRQDKAGQDRTRLWKPKSAQGTSGDASWETGGVHPTLKGILPVDPGRRNLTPSRLLLAPLRPSKSDPKINIFQSIIEPILLTFLFTKWFPKPPQIDKIN